MKVLETGFFRALVRMCDDAYRAGWHECHGGNLSYRLSRAEVAEADDLDPAGAWEPTGIHVPDLAGEALLITAKGQVFRNTSRDPEGSLGIIEISEDGDFYRVLWGLSGGGRPTSELPAHLADHQVIRRRSDGRLRLVYHAHPTNLIALSFLLPPDEVLFTRELWKMMPECPMIFPAGIGVLGWMVPGDAAIAAATMEKMETFDIVLWAQHGVFAAGEGPDDCFGLVETAEKAAEILIKVRSCGPALAPVPGPGEMRALAQAFRLPLKERFLREDGRGGASPEASAP